MKIFRARCISGAKVLLKLGGGGGGGLDEQVAGNSKLWCETADHVEVAPSRQTVWAGGGGDNTHMI